MRPPCAPAKVRALCTPSRGLDRAGAQLLQEGERKVIRSTIATTAALLTVLSAGEVFAQDQEEEVTPGLFGTSILEGWNKYMGLGFTGTDGNVNETRLVFDAKGEFENERHRRKLVSQFYLSKPDSDSPQGTDRKAFVDYEENWKPFGDKFYLLGTGRYDYERFQPWKSRITGSLGVGYEIFNYNKTVVRGSVGAGVAYKFDTRKTTAEGEAIDIDNETIPEGVIRLGIDHNVTEGVDFSTTHTYYPNFDDTDELRIISDAELKADIGEAGGLNVALGVVNEYDSIADNVDKSVETNDLTYYLRFGYDF